MLIQPAHALLRDMQVLLPAQDAALVNPLVYSNAGALGDAAFHRWLLWTNAARTVHQPAVRLGYYAAPAIMDGSAPFHVLTGEALVQEQVYFKDAELAAHVAYLRAAARDAVVIHHPCLLASHPGTWTWGHWLIDTLPKIVLAERAYPGGFSFVVPAVISDPASSGFFVRSVLESLAAYGIAPERLLRLQPGAAYRFQTLFDLTDMRGHDGMHPGILAAMRNLPAPPPSRARQALTAVMRRAYDTRQIINRAALDPVLRAYRASELDPGAAPFLEQVRAFRDSDVIVGDLGSNLAACLYANQDAGIVTMAPGGWRDSYFGSLFQRLAPRHADIRGPVCGEAPVELSLASYSIDPQQLEAGLHAATQPGAAHLPVNIDGSPLPRALGPEVLRIEFGARGNAGAFQRNGFSAAEDRYTWSIGPKCTLVVADFAASHGDLWLAIKGAGFIAPPRLMSRPLDVTANGVVLGRFETDDEMHLQMLLPASVSNRAVQLTLEFHHSVCPSPYEMGVSQDTRALGFRFEEITLFRRI